MDNKMSFIACMFFFETGYIIHCTFNSCTKQNDLPRLNRGAVVPPPGGKRALSSKSA